MTVTDNAYVAVLENKLQQAERSLDEFRKIFTHWTARDREPVLASSADEPIQMSKSDSGGRERKGLYPGQYSNHITIEEDFDPGEAGKSEQECVE